MADFIVNETREFEVTGAKFSGQWRNGYPLGGTLSFYTGRSGALVSGQFTATDKTRPNVGDWVGSGWCTDRYSGEWENGLFHGRGRIEWGNGGTYEGEFKRGLASGEGERVWPNGDRYIGGWHEGQRCGMGVFTRASSHARSTDAAAEDDDDGLDHVDDRGHDDGRRAASSSSSSSKAIDPLPSSSIDNQTLSNSIANALALPALPSSSPPSDRSLSSFLRSFVSNSNGPTKVIAFYDGKWLDDLPSGNGVCVYLDGSKYEGEWKAGKRHGIGTLLEPDGSRSVDALWRNGALVGSQPHTFYLPSGTPHLHASISSRPR